LARCSAATRNNIVICLAELIINGLILYFLVHCRSRIGKEIKALVTIMKALGKPVSLDRFNLLTAKHGNNQAANIKRLRHIKTPAQVHIQCRTHMLKTH